MNDIRKTIGWADISWNPIEGCSLVSTGCAHCYAFAMALRFHRPWGTPVFRGERMQEPLRRRKPAVFFCCSTSDLWHPGVHPEWRESVFAMMRQAPQHRYVVLTKRPELIPEDWIPPDNLWVGISAENQEWHEERWQHIALFAHTVVSVEPMLGPVSVPCRGWALPPDWVLCGPETGCGARECKPEWIEALYAKCREAGIPFWDKRKTGWLSRERPEGMP